MNAEDHNMLRGYLKQIDDSLAILTGASPPIRSSDADQCRIDHGLDNRDRITRAVQEVDAELQDGHPALADIGSLPGEAKAERFFALLRATLFRRGVCVACCPVLAEAVWVASKYGYIDHATFMQR